MTSFRHSEDYSICLAAQVPEKQWLARSCPAVHDRCQARAVRSESNIDDAVPGTMFEDIGVKIKYLRAQREELETRVRLVGIAASSQYRAIRRECQGRDASAVVANTAAMPIAEAA